MRRILVFVTLAVMFACDSDNFNNRNPFIPNYRFEVVIDMNLPLYSSLIHPGNGIYYGDGGARGLIIFNAGGSYSAFDAACPNQAISACSTLQISAPLAICPCDNAEYNLFTGESPGLQYPLKRYRIQQNGTALIVSN